MISSTTNVCSRFGSPPHVTCISEGNVALTGCQKPLPLHLLRRRSTFVTQSRVPTQLGEPWYSCPLLGDQGESIISGAQRHAFYRDNIATCRNPSVTLEDAASRMGSLVVTGISGCNYPFLVSDINIYFEKNLLIPQLNINQTN